MSFKSSTTFLAAITIIIIVFAIAISSVLQVQPEKPFSKILTFGPVWDGTKWSCTSDRDFILHGAMRGLQAAQLEIHVSGFGTQSFYSLEPERMESFSVGSPADHNVILTRTGTVSGWITLQTISDATASCVQS